MTHDHNKVKPALDLWGSIASITCAIHCSLLPFVISLGMLSGWKWLQNEWVDFGFILISLILVTWSLGSSYKDVHQKKGPLTLAIIGFIVFGLGHFLWHHEYEMYLSTAGGLLIASSHYFNWKLNKTHLVSCDVE